MKRNNFMSLFIHLIVSGITVAIYQPSSKKGYISSFSFKSEIAIFILLMLSYFVFSYLLAGNILLILDSWKKRISSTLAVSILILFAWTIGYLLDDNGNIFSDFGWIFFYYLSRPFTPIYSIMERFWKMNDIFPNWTILFVITPSMLIWLGIEIKQYVILRKAKT